MSFVATAPATNRLLTTVDNVRLSGAVPADTEDDAVEELIRQGSAAVETYTGRVFAKETGIQTERLTCSAWRIFLERTPVVSIASVVEDGTTLDADEYEVDTQTGILRKLADDAYSYWSGKVVITYTGGYVLPDDAGTPNLPADIEAAVILFLGNSNALSTSFSSSHSGGTGIKRKSVLNGLIDITYMTPSESASSSSAATQTQNAMSALLDKYRRLYI
jgi:hypothetical protein